MDFKNQDSLFQILKHTINFDLKLNEHGADNTYLLFMYCFFLFVIVCVYNYLYKDNTSDFLVLYLFIVLFHINITHFVMTFKFDQNKLFSVLTFICSFIAFFYMNKWFNNKKEKYNRMSLVLVKKGNNQTNELDNDDELVGVDL